MHDMASYPIPTTPARGSEPRATSNRIQSLQDTPHNKGTSGHTNHSTHYTNEDFKPYLKEDLRNHTLISFDDFLEHILHVPTDWRIKEQQRIHEIIHMKPYVDNIKRYAELIVNETDRYAPFVELINHAIYELQKGSESNFPIKFCRNDPVYVHGSKANRKPDVLGVVECALHDPGRRCVDELSEKGPHEKPFCWTDVVTFFEFKVNRRHLAKVGTVTQLIGALESKTDDLSFYKGTPGSSNPSNRVPPTSPLPPIASPPNVSNPESLSQPCARNSRSSGSRAQSGGISTRSMTLNPNTDSSRKRPLSSDVPKTSQRKRSKTNSDRHPDEIATREDLKLQCASYALEILSHGGLRNHVIAASITDFKIELYYFDHSTIVISRPIDFLQDTSSFLAMLRGLSNLTCLSWGYEQFGSPQIPTHEPLNPREKVSSYLLENQTIEISGKRLKLGKTVYQQHGLIGRGTWVIRAVNESDGGADRDKRWNTGLIVKLSWCPKTRNPEHLIIKEARSRAEGKSVLGHLPDVLSSHEIDRTAEGPVEGLMKLLGDEYEPRVLRLLVMEELFPVVTLTTAAKVAKVFRDVFYCYKWLYLEANIFHRDISLNNLMFRKKDGEIFGVLNDYDLAIIRSKKGGPTSKTRTGTKPFMAIDLLGREPDDVQHRYRHDLESLFYVLIYLTSRYHEGQEIPNPPFQDWDILGEEALKSAKASFLLTGSLPDGTDHFKGFTAWTIEFQFALEKGLSARTRHRNLLKHNKTASSFDDETLGGHVSFDTFSKIFKKDIH